MKKITEKEIQNEATRIKKEYAYMDSMPLDGWFWEIIRRSPAYKTLCDELAALSVPISKEHSDTIDMRLDDIGISIQYLFPPKSGIPLPPYLEPCYLIDHDDPEAEQKKVVKRELEVVPRPNLSYHDFCRLSENRYGFGPAFLLVRGVRPSCQIITPKQLRANVEIFKDLLYEKTKSEMGIGFIMTEEQFIEKFLRLSLSMFFSENADDTILVRIDKKAKIKEVEEYLLPELRKHLKSSKPKIRAFEKWKYYLIVYDLKTRHPDWSYDDISDVLNDAFPPSKEYMVLDSRTILNYYKQALFLLNGEYKKYLYKIKPAFIFSAIMDHITE